MASSQLRCRRDSAVELSLVVAVNRLTRLNCLRQSETVESRRRRRCKLAVMNMPAELRIFHVFSISLIYSVVVIIIVVMSV